MSYTQGKMCKMSLKDCQAQSLEFPKAKVGDSGVVFVNWVPLCTAADSNKTSVGSSTLRGCRAKSLGLATLQSLGTKLGP